VVISKFERPEREQGVQQFFCHVACLEEHAKYGMVERIVLNSANRKAT
jgi:hypothetical protein